VVSVGETSGATGPRAALRLIGSRNFGPYFVGNAASASGTWFQNLAASLLVYRQTHSPFLLGVLNFCNFIPILVLAPWAGSMADRFDRRRIIVVTQLGSTGLSALLAVLAWSGRASVPVVLVCALGLGVGSAFGAPASQALIGDLVPRSELPSAVGLNSMTYNLARAVGPALAALSVRTLGIPASFAINSASYLLLVVGVLVVHAEPRRRASRAETRLRESMRLVIEQPRLLGLLLVVAAVGFSSDPINTEAPAFAHVFGRPDTDAGYVIGAFGVGAVTAAFVLAGRVTGSLRRLQAMLLLMGGGIIGFSLASWLGLGYVFLAIAGFGYLASNTSATSRLQLDVAEHQRGRIMALWSVAFLGLRPIASLLDGAVAGAFGVRAAGVLLAIPVLLAAAGIYFLQRHHLTITNRA
jgi:MFS family permease